jgi:hypothetical protein
MNLAPPGLELRTKVSVRHPGDAAYPGSKTMEASVRSTYVVLALFVLSCGGLPLFRQSPNPVPLINDPLVPTTVVPLEPLDSPLP